MTGYYLVRLILMVCLLAGMILFFKKKPCRKIIRVVCVACLSVVIIALCVIPFENLFVSFDTPKSAFRYAYRGDILETEIGDDSAAILYRQDTDQTSVVFLGKKNDKYKLSAFLLKETIASVHNDGLTITLYKIDRTSDFYIRISGVTASEIHLSDNAETVFRPHYDQLSNGQVSVDCLALVNFSSTYQLCINGEQVDLS